ncbi:MAG: hypothetical protein IJV44_12970 [Prevotella sp.]|nr:hypothetical protein [Prevotella sp.]
MSKKEETEDRYMPCPSCGRRTKGNVAWGKHLAPAAAGGAAGFAVGGPIGAIVGTAAGLWVHGHTINYNFVCPNCGCKWKQKFEE